MPSIPALLKDSAQTAVQNADPRIRTFFVEDATAVAVGDWVSIDLATSTNGVGNSVISDLSLVAKVGVALDATAGSEWIRVVTRGVASGNLTAGVTAGDSLSADAANAGHATTHAAGAEDPRIGLALEDSGAGGVVLCYVTCE